MRVRDLWPFPVALPVGKPRLCRRLAVWLSGNPPGARLLERQPASSQSPQPPGLALRLAPTQRRTKIGEGGRGRGGPRCTELLQDISGPFMGTGPGGAHATLSSVVVSLMLAYPHSSALHPCSSRFLFDCDLLPSHRGPQLSTLLVPLSGLFACPCLSPPHTRPTVVSCRVASSLPALAHRIASSAATHTGFIYLPPSTCCTPRDIHERHRCFGLSVGRRLSASFPVAAWPGTQPATAIRLAASKSRGPWYQNFWTRTEITSREVLGRWLAFAPSPGVSPGCGRWAAQPRSVLLG